MSDDIISRSALKKAMWDESYSIATFTECGAEISRLGLTITEIEHIIDNAPTVLHDNYSMGYQDGVRKVLSERPQGEWLIIDDTEQFIAKCSVCGRIEDSRMVKDYPFCHCGADMRVKDELKEAENEDSN